MKRVRGIVLLAALVFSEACYHTRTYITAVPPATPTYQYEVRDSFFWGLLQHNVEVGPEQCPSNALSEVRTTTNLGYALLTVVTLGIWSRTIVEYKCAKEPPPSPPPGEMRK